MTVADFRRVAPGLPGTDDFRVGSRISGTALEELPEFFVPIHGGWGRMGMTPIRLAAAAESVLEGAVLG
jgi:hypothetical protein